MKLLLLISFVLSLAACAKPRTLHEFLLQRQADCVEACGGGLDLRRRFVCFDGCAEDYARDLARIDRRCAP